MHVIGNHGGSHKRFFVGLSTSSVLLFFLSVSFASAATLQLSPAAGSHTVGDTFIISVRVSSTDQAMNAASGVVNFPPDLLQVTSLSKSASVMGLWVQEPSFSNAAGTVDFEGVVLNPGFSGASGDVVNITFRAKKAGDAALTITGGSVLANDGNGTEILTGASGATISVGDAVETAPLPKPAPVKATPAPKPAPASSEGPAVILQPPIITHVSTNVAIGSVAEIDGSSIYPGATAHLTLQRGTDSPVELESIVGGNGVFSFAQAHTLPSGDYTGSVYVVQDGTQSPPSAAFVIRFEGQPLSARITDLLAQPGVVLAFSIILAFILGMFCVRFLLGAPTPDKSMRAALNAVDTEVHKAFLQLRERINRSLGELERESVNRELTPAEKHFVREMTGTIKETEKIVTADIREGGK